MSNVPSTDNSEIDLLLLLQVIWKGKWKIVSIITLSLISVFGFYIIKPEITFTASTEIKPITSSEFDRYILFNSSLGEFEDDSENYKAFNFFEISRKSLYNAYIEKIEEGSLLEIGIDKFNLINKVDFNSESDYKEAVEKFASEILVLKPINTKEEKRSYHLLSGEYDDKIRWKKLLKFVNQEANKKVKDNIINRFATMVSVENQKKDFAIKDLEIKIENVKKDYDTKTKNRIAFLAEQAAIARKLDLKRNTIASQRFNTQNTIVTSVKTDAPFYLRGYLAIEEEIKLVTSRKDKNAFSKGLIKLEQQKRTLEQDETIDRAINLFNKTPLNQGDFKATIVKVATTDFEENDKSNLFYALTIILGSIIGVVYVLVDNAFLNRRN